MLVLDASAAVELVLNRAAAATIQEAVLEHDASLHAPHLLDDDAAYVALVEALSEDGAALLTADSRLASAVAAHTELEVVVANP